MTCRERCFKIFGKIIRAETGEGIPNLTVKAIDKDLLFDDLLGAAQTDEQGRFEITYDQEDFQELFFDKKPDIYLKIKNSEGRVICATDNAVRYGSGTTEEFIVKIPKSLLGETVEGNDIIRAKEILRKIDPTLSMMAIRQAEVDFDEVDRIKKFLYKRNPEAVQYALAELQQEAVNMEVKVIKEKLKSFSLDALKQAAVELGLADKVGLCIDHINCRGRCIQVMTIRCTQEMYVVFNRDEMINPGVTEAIFNRAVLKAMAQIQLKREF